MTSLKSKKSLSLIWQIVIGLVLGAIIGQFANYAIHSPNSGINPQIAKSIVNVIGILGDLFVGALKAVAPFLVFVLVTSAVAKHNHGVKTNIRPILFLYLLGTFGAAVVAVVGSFMFPSSITLVGADSVDVNPPEGIGAVLHNLLMNLVSNPFASLVNANYIGILFWAILLGLALRRASVATLDMIHDVSHAVSAIVQWIIKLAPFGILGLVTVTTATTGFGKHAKIRIHWF